MSIYYWDTDTEKQLEYGKLSYPYRGQSSEEEQFWKRIPSHLIISEGTDPPSLYEQITDLRKMVALQQVLYFHPFDFGSIKSRLREILYHNIYVHDNSYLFASEVEASVAVKGMVENMIGACYKLITQYPSNQANHYFNLLDSLQSDVLKIADDDIINISFGYTEPTTELSWKGSQHQLDQLFEGLKFPIVAYKERIRFIDENTDFISFQAIFDSDIKSTKIEWLEISPLSKERTISCLRLLISKLADAKLIPQTNNTVIKNLLKSHFCNKPDGTLSNITESPSQTTPQAKHIIDLVIRIAENCH